MRVLINASNLHVGGGVAVASSFIHELAEDEAWAPRSLVQVSSEVFQNLRALGTRTSEFLDFECHDVVGIRGLVSRSRLERKKYDLVFTIFGPDYKFRGRVSTVTGLAQPWIVYPKNDAFMALSPLRKLLSRFKYAMQIAFFRRSSALVVESAQIAEIVARRVKIEEHKIFVVNNAVDSVFRSSQRWEVLEMPAKRSTFRFGYPARNYPHKNIQILPEVRTLLRDKYGIDIEIIVTLSDGEWQRLNSDSQRELVNVGPLSLSQLPSFYSQVDGVIFPSLLECFSAVPIEALACGKPLFASNRPFVRCEVGDYAYYFDPVDANDIAEIIARALSGTSWREHTRLRSGAEFIWSMYGSSKRTAGYLSVLSQV